MTPNALATLVAMTQFVNASRFEKNKLEADKKSKIWSKKA